METDKLEFFEEFLFFGMLIEELLDFLFSVGATEELLDFDFALELHQAIEESFGTRRTTGDIDIDRQDLVDTGHNAIGILEGTAGNGATAAGDNIFRLGELFIEAHESRGHLMDDGALHHNIVCLTRRVAGHFEPEAGHVVARGTEAHELDSAAARAETEGPKRIGNTPINEFVEVTNDHVGPRRIQFVDKFVDIFIVFEVLAGHAFNFHFHFKAPFLQA